MKKLFLAGVTFFSISIFAQNIEGWKCASLYEEKLSSFDVAGPIKKGNSFNFNYYADYDGSQKNVKCKAVLIFCAKEDKEKNELTTFIIELPEGNFTADFITKYIIDEQGKGTLSTIKPVNMKTLTTDDYNITEYGNGFYLEKYSIFPLSTYDSRVGGIWFQTQNSASVSFFDKVTNDGKNVTIIKSKYGHSRFMGYRAINF